MARKKKAEETPKGVDDRASRLAVFFKQAEKNYGKGSVGFAVDHGHGDIKRIATGILPLDVSLGGGLPVGRVSMFYGPKSSSKTTCFLRSAGRAQRMCSNCWTPAFPIWTPFYDRKMKPACRCGDYRQTNVAWLDVEGVWDEKWSDKFLDRQSLVFTQPETGEQTCDIAHALLSSDTVDVIVIDSVAFMIPVEDLEKSAADSSVGTQARLLGDMFRKLVATTNSLGQKSGRRPTVWFTNQIRHKVGVMFGSPETVPGGFAQGFATSTETRMAPVKAKFDEYSMPYAMGMKFRNEKNKTAPAKMEGEYLLYTRDMDNRKAGEVDDLNFAMRVGQQVGLVEVGKGSSGTICDGEKYSAQGLLKKHWIENPDKYEEFKNKVFMQLSTPVKENEASL